MPRRRVNRRPQSTRQPFVDVDRSTDSSNNSANTSDVWRHKQDSGNIASAQEPDIMEYNSQSHNEFPALSPVTPMQCCVPVSSTSSPAAPAADTHTGFADFVFWKPQLPMVDDEIAALLHDHPAHPVPSVNQISSLPMPASRAVADRADVNGGFEFNEFNYWRKPIVDFDVELESLQL